MKMQRRKKNPHFPLQNSKTQNAVFLVSNCPQDHESFTLEDVRFRGQKDAGKAGLS